MQSPKHARKPVALIVAFIAALPVAACRSTGSDAELRSDTVGKDPQAPARNRPLSLDEIKAEFARIDWESYTPDKVPAPSPARAGIAEDQTLPPPSPEAVGKLGEAPAGMGLAGYEAKYDLRAFDTPARDQGSRNTCTAFAIVSAMENKLRRLYGNSYDLSEEHLWSKYNEAHHINAINAAQANVIASEADAPYNGYVSPQLGGWVGVRKAFELTVTHDEVAQAMRENSPLLFRMADADKIVAGANGVIPNFTPTGAFGHALALVGVYYSSDFPGGGVYILKNSVGPYWGDNGYGYLPFAHCAKALAGCLAFRINSLVVTASTLTLTPPAGTYKNMAGNSCDQTITPDGTSSFTLKMVNCPAGVNGATFKLNCYGNICSGLAPTGEEHRVIIDTKERYYWDKTTKGSWFHSTGGFGLVGDGGGAPAGEAQASQAAEGAPMRTGDRWSKVTGKLDAPEALLMAVNLLNVEQAVDVRCFVGRKAAPGVYCGTGDERAAAALQRLLKDAGLGQEALRAAPGEEALAL